jgi:predicted ATPase/DNA-binding SARP family transcriptional activator
MIPRELTTLIGRERELGEIEALLSARPLLTLRGPGGSGKTRLALRVARYTERRLEDGVAWVDLAPVTHPSRVTRAVCSAFGLHERTGAAAEDALRSHLRGRSTLLVIDSCEHLIGACAELVSRLLATDSDLRILATSREPLHVPGETVWLVPSLSVPPRSLPRGADALEAVLGSQAGRLFSARAGAVHPGFEITGENAGAIGRICRRLEGMPLGIELCAAHVASLTPEQLAARLEAGLPLPATGGRLALSRHRTLEATIDWSHGLLTDPERTVFRRLSVFAGDASLEATEAVCAGGGLAKPGVLDVVASLIDKSLVVMEGNEGEGRYRLLEPVRHYAAARLRASGEELRVRARHTSHFLRLAEESAPHLQSGGRRAWIDALEVEHDHFRAGWEYARAAADAQSMQRQVAALFWFWHFAGHIAEGRQFAEEAVEAGTEPTPARVSALHAAGSLAWMQGDFPAGRLRLEESVAIARELMEPVLLSRSLRELGNVWMFEGDRDAARRCYDESVELARGGGEDWDLALALTMLGDVVEGQDGVPAARGIFRESEKIFRRLGDRWGIAMTLFSLALIAGRDGDHDEARRFGSESLALRRAEGDPWTIAEGLTLLGELALRQGEPARAAEAFNEALGLYHDLGDHAGTSLLLHDLAGTLADRGEAARPARLFGASESLGRTIEGRSPYTLLTPEERADKIRVLRARLGEEAFLQGWAEGSAMPPSDAVALALAGTRLEQGGAAEDVELRVFAFGEPRVFLGERLLLPGDWSFALPRELLYYLLSHRSRTKEQVGLDFWPDASTEQLRGRFRTTLHSLRRALGSTARVTFEDGRYAFNRGLPHAYDVEAFESHLTMARQVERTMPQQAILHFEAAAETYQGDFMAGVEVGEWATPIGEGLKRSYIDALASLGMLHAAQSRYVDAVRWYLRALSHDDLLETAHLELIRCYARLGQRGRALRHYARLEALLERELGSPPGKEVMALAERVRRAEAV